TERGRWRRSKGRRCVSVPAVASPAPLARQLPRRQARRSSTGIVSWPRNNLENRDHGLLRRKVLLPRGPRPSRAQGGALPNQKGFVRSWCKAVPPNDPHSHACDFEVGVRGNSDLGIQGVLALLVRRAESRLSVAEREGVPDHGLVPIHPLEPDALQRG